MITIDYKSRQPIFEQIIERIKQLVLTGVYQRDDKLPTVRQLAQDLAINPNTIQKAYAELERQGVIYSLKGKGSFVGSSFGELSAIQKEKLFTQLDQLVGELHQIRVPEEELHHRITEKYREWEGTRS